MSSRLQRYLADFYEKSYGAALNGLKATLPGGKDYPTGFLSIGNPWKHGIEARR